MDKVVSTVLLILIVVILCLIIFVFMNNFVIGSLGVLKTVQTKLTKIISGLLSKIKVKI